MRFFCIFVSVATTTQTIAAHNITMAKKSEPTYVPPFTVSAEAINLIAEISGLIERYAIRMEQSDGLLLRKANRIKTIHLV